MVQKKPEKPLTKLVRLLGGTVLMHGRLGHQVLGQMLTLNLSQPEHAGAALAISAASRQRRVASQAAIGMVASTLAAQTVANKMDERLTRREEALLKREQALEEAEKQAREAGSNHANVPPSPNDPTSALAQATEELSKLRAEKQLLEEQLAALRSEMQPTGDDSSSAPPSSLPAVPRRGGR
ncbi:MAG: hypothetical protein IPK82_40275 [Polyangiaceae bacterium]|nr:hypothetical protein [Polyangiaceae bacterium]